MKKICLLFVVVEMVLSVLFSTVVRGQEEKKPKVKLGLEVLLEERTELIKNKKIGLITNHTGINSKFESNVDLLFKYSETQVGVLFGPEHGFRGAAFAGEEVGDYVDPRTKVMIYSLSGEIQKPTPEMLKGIEVLIYDIQDIGSRGYAYINTMSYCMQAAKENNIKFVVLDRPNPLGGELVDGNVLDPKFASDISRYPIAYVYGLTPGELALYFNTEFKINADLEVVKMKGWTRKMKFADTGLPWVPTSPHIPKQTTAYYCVMTGIMGELQTVNGGVGYTLPFEVVGAPYIDSDKLATELNSRQLDGVYFRPISYDPQYHTYAKQKCHGVQVHITDYDKVKPVSVGIHIMEALNKLYPEKSIFLNAGKRIEMFDKAMGTDAARLALEKGETAVSIIDSWKKEIKWFMRKREKYLLY